MSGLNKIAIIGCGRMGSAFAERLAKHHALTFYNHTPKKAEILEQKGYGKACATLEEAVRDVDAVVLAIKPQNLSTFKTDLHFPLLISLLAGTSLETLKKTLQAKQIIRVMPNLAIRVGEGLLGVVPDRTLPTAQKAGIEMFLAPLGTTHWLTEDQMNGFTALAGSGPAFVLAILQAFAQAGQPFTLPQDLTLKMVQGTLSLLQQSGQTPTELIAQIASPGGTTQAGLKVLQDQHLDTLIAKTLQAAITRAEELS